MRSKLFLFLRNLWIFVIKLITLSFNDGNDLKSIDLKTWFEITFLSCDFDLTTFLQITLWQLSYLLIKYRLLRGRWLGDTAMIVRFTVHRFAKFNILYHPVLRCRYFERNVGACMDCMDCVLRTAFIWVPVADGQSCNPAREYFLHYWNTALYISPRWYSSYIAFVSL